MHLKLPPAELQRLGRRIDEDFQGAHSDHQRRIARFRRYYQLWRNRLDPQVAVDKNLPNFQVPLLQWNLLAKLAQEMNALLGDDAEIVAVPVGPSDQRNVHKVGRYMTWRMFNAMRIVTPLTVFEFRKLLNGRAHAYRPWDRRTYRTPKGEALAYEGPAFIPLSADDIVVPGEDRQSIHDFSWVIRKYRVTPQQLLDGERKGKYFGIRKNFERIVQFARDGREREPVGDDIAEEMDLAEGVQRDGQATIKNTLLCYEWYGKWRMLKGSRDVPEDDIKGRELDESDIVVRYLPDLQLVVGVIDLMDLYPDMERRRPFCEASLIKDGSYWSMGMGEMLESIQDETTANHRLFTQAGMLQVGPVLFYRPGGGFNPETFRYQPFTAIPTDNPADVQAVLFKGDLQYNVVKEQTLRVYSEMVSGISDQTLGRAIDRPNAPRTASGQLALIEQGNIRLSLDVLQMREDFAQIASDIWDLDCQFSPESVFFRVTEEEAKGLFPTAHGGAQMTAEERASRFDFSIKFATSYWSREANKERVLARYQLDLANPLIAGNPRALWMVTNEAHKALGDSNFAQIVPEPPDLGLPKHPREEWTLALQGEDFDVHPMDNDDLHLIDHLRRTEEARRDPRGDPGAVRVMIQHIIAHQQQKRQKMLMQAMVSQVAGDLARQTANPEMGGLNLRGPVPMPLQQFSAELQGMMQGAAAPEGATDGSGTA